MEFSLHAINRYAERTGRNVAEAKNDLSQIFNANLAAKFTMKNIKLTGFRVRTRKVYRDNQFFIWVDTITNEKVCAIEHDGTIITILSQSL